MVHIQVLILSLLKMVTESNLNEMGETGAYYTGVKCKPERKHHSILTHILIRR